MTIARRHILLVATTLTASALVGRFSALSAFGPRNSSEENAATDPDVMVLHDGSAPCLVFARQVQAASGKVRFDDLAISVLTLKGFTQTRALLEDATSRVVFALFDDAESLVMEVLLEANGAAGLLRRRHGHQVLLTARL